MSSAEKLRAATSHNPEELSDPASVIRRIIHLAHEIEQTCGYGKSHTFGMVPVNGHSQREWEAKIRRDQEWADTTFKWKNERRPLIAELQTLVELHRKEFPELAGLVEQRPWEGQMLKEQLRARIGSAAIAVVERIDATSSGARRNRLVDPIPIASVVSAKGHKAGRADKLAKKMRRRNYLVDKIAGKNHCQRADAIAKFPRHKQRIEEIE